MDQKQKTNVLLGLFVAAIIAANLLGTKIADFGFFVASVGIFSYPITFLITDAVEEVYGKEKTKIFVNVGFIALVFVLLLTMISVAMPSAERDFFPNEYATVFSMSFRIFIASIIGFLISQYHDIWAFNFWKNLTAGKYLWLRNNMSTIVSQFIDSTLFMFIAFYNVTPKHGVGFIFSLIIPYWIVKVGVALLDTPFVYGLVWWLKKK